MITSSHIIYHWVLARKLDNTLGESKIRVMGAMIGGFLPDIPVYLFFFYQTLAQISHQEMWHVLYFDSAWTPFFTLSHSFILWPVLIALGYAFKQKLLFWIASGALLHSATDFLVHADDAYRHFWPLSDWQWRSPISYWDPQYYGNIVGSIDTVLIFLLLLYLAKKTQGKKIKYLLVTIGLLYLSMLLLTFHAILM